MALYLPLVMTSAVVLTSLLAVVSFLLYNYMVSCQSSIFLEYLEYFLFQFHPWAILISHQDDTTTCPEEDTEYEDILIPVPYDPEITGVRCDDVEDIEDQENEVVVMELQNPREEEEEDAMENEEVEMIELQNLEETLEPSLSVGVKSPSEVGEEVTEADTDC